MKRLLFMALFLTGCAEGITIDIDGLPCSNSGECVEGWVCHPDTALCVDDDLPDAIRSDIEVADATLIANGVATTLVTVLTHNADGNLVGGASVSIQTTFGDLLALPRWTSEGTYTQLLRAPTTVGATDLTFSIGDEPAMTTASVEFTAGWATDLVIVSSALTVPAGACSAAVRIGSQDSNGNDSAVETDTPVTMTSDSGTTTFYSDASCANQAISVTLTAGTSEVEFHFIDSTVGSPTLTVTASGLVPGRQVQSVE